MEKHAGAAQLKHLISRFPLHSDLWCSPTPRASRIRHLICALLALLDVLQAVAVQECIAKGLTECPEYTLDECLSIMQTMDEVRRQLGVKYSVDD